MDRIQCIVLICLFTAISQLLQATAQTRQSDAADENKKEFSISVGVDEVQLDVVILDHGHQVTDLTANDFEIYQDGKLQKTESVIYVKDNKSAPLKKNRKQKDSWPKQLTSAPLIQQDQIRRAVVFLIDDMTIGFADFQKCRGLLNKFIENEMQPGDMIAILRTGYGSSAAQFFSSDKQQLISLIGNMRWGKINPMPVGNAWDEGPGPDPRVSHTRSIDPFWGELAGAYSKENSVKQEKLGEIDAVSFQLSALRYCVRALRDMPGRKSLMFVSGKTILPWQQNSLTMNLVNSLADEAMRAGVVINMLDITGRNDPIFSKEYPFPEKTGGMLLKGVGFWTTRSGIGPASELINGYYLLSYIPPKGTFSKEKFSHQYHKIEVKTKKGTVHTRDGFYGVENNDIDLLARAPISLQEVLYSPFLYTDLDVRLASGYAFIPKFGYFIRAWMHVDAKNLSFVDTGNGESKLVLEISSVITDSKSFTRFAKGYQCDLTIKNEEIPQIKKNGFDFTTYLKFKDINPYNIPGLYKKKDDDDPGYYVRAAVRDLTSKKSGSTYQFLQVNDVKKKNRLALSSIFLFNRDQDLLELKEGKDDATQSGKKLNWQTPPRSPALRSYLPGEGFDYLIIAYNGKEAGKEAPELESQILLFKDGQKFSKGTLEDVEAKGIKDPNMIPIVKRLVLGKELESGDYVLQVGVRDKNPIKKIRAAIQSIDFQIQGPETSKGMGDAENEKIIH